MQHDKHKKIPKSNTTSKNGRNINEKYTKHNVYQTQNTQVMSYQKIYPEQTIYATTKNQTQRIVENNTTK